MNISVNDVQAKLRPTPELLAELAEASARLESADPDAILRWAVDRFGDRLTMATAFGPEGMTILDRLSRLGLKVHVFNLDTGYQFQETLDLCDQVARRYGIEVELMRPELSTEEYEAMHGGPVYKSDPDRCCRDRKLAVLQRAIVGRHAWISAIRRDQSRDRAQAPTVGWDQKFQLVKVNPLVNETRTSIWQYIVDRDVPYNPLHDKGFPSIGCWPCTRSVLFGGDEREGRWTGTQKTECGLHSLDSETGGHEATGERFTADMGRHL